MPRGEEYSMINSVAASVATPSSATTATAGQSTRASQLNLLTSSDWATVSASVGRPCGPDASGNISGLQPLLAFTIASARAHGGISAGQSVSVSDLKAFGSGDQPAGFEDQIQNAIDYLTENVAGQSTTATSTHTVDLLA
jgi:hypothetical protein